MNNTIKMRINHKGSVAKVKALIKHPMETGFRRDSKTKELIPPKFIQEVTCKHNDTTVLDAEWGVAISKNPFISFSIDNAKVGDTISLIWKDNLENSDSVSKTIG